MGAMIRHTYLTTLVLLCAFVLAGCSAQTSKDFKRDVNEIAREVDSAFEK